MVVIRDTEDNIFGGYADVSWKPEILGITMTNKSDAAFLFTAYEDGEVEKFPIDPELAEFALMCPNTHLLSFGGMNRTDLFIGASCDQHKRNTRKQCCYQYPDENESMKNFQVSEMEIFALSEPTSVDSSVVSAMNQTTTSDEEDEEEEEEDESVSSSVAGDMTSLKRLNAAVSKFSAELKRTQKQLDKDTFDFLDELHFTTYHFGIEVLVSKNPKYKNDKTLLNGPGEIAAIVDVIVAKRAESSSD
eukprot:gene27552-34285_t